MKYIIKAPSDFSGKAWGLIFADGVATTHDEALAIKLGKHGYTVTAEATQGVIMLPSTPAADDPPPTDPPAGGLPTEEPLTPPVDTAAKIEQELQALGGLSRPELDAKATEMGLDISAAKNKPDVIDIITGALKAALQPPAE